MTVPRVLIAMFVLLALPARAAAPGLAPQSFEGRLLAAHNQARVAHGIAPLQWSAKLAGQAGIWAQTLAARGAFEHSPSRQGAGENLWMGTTGYFAPEDMIGEFVKEGRRFRPGRFPDVSSSGNWADVGHYTQVIWPATQEVGCALQTGHGKDVLVCRYLPAGNMMGALVP